MECELRDEFFYLAPGDFSIARKKTTGRSSYFPLSHYHGITILIDTEHATKCLSCLLADVEVAPDELSKKFCGEDGCYIARSKPYIAHIFSELYSVPESIKKGYFKVKILELLLYLSGMEPENETAEIKAYSQSQTELAKACANTSPSTWTTELLSRRYRTFSIYLARRLKIRSRESTEFRYIRTSERRKCTPQR